MKTLENYIVIQKKALDLCKLSGTESMIIVREESKIQRWIHNKIHYLGWILQEAESETEFTIRYLLGSVLESTPVEGRGGKQDWAEGETELWNRPDENLSWLSREVSN